MTMLIREGGNSHFSLRDEARFTGGRQSFWTTNTKLRSHGVQFVSAGFHSTMEDEAEAEESSTSTPQDTEATGRDVSTTLLPQTREARTSPLTVLSPSAIPFVSGSNPNVEHKATNAVPAQQRTTSPSIEAPNPFFIDIVGEASAVPQTRRPKVRSPSPAKSDSSDEVVFQGRASTQTRVLEDPVVPPPQQLIEISTTTDITPSEKLVG